MTKKLDKKEIIKHKLRRGFKYIGRKIGNIRIISFTLKSTLENSIFNCICDCGNFCTKTYASIMQKNRDLSCGCNQYQYFSGKSNYLWKGYGEISAHLWHRYKSGGKVRNILFDLDIKDAWNLFLKQNKKCALSGEIISFGKSHKERSLTTASLDRIDPSRHYTLDNVWWIHKIINEMKWDLSLDRFLYLCNLIHKPLTHRIKNISCVEIHHHKNWKGFGNIGFDFFTQYEKNAIIRKIKHNISIEYMWDLFLKQEGYCAVTGLPISCLIKNRTASLDRINNSLGYIEGNLQWTHIEINQKIRKSLTMEELKIWTSKISKETNEKKIPIH